MALIRAQLKRGLLQSLADQASDASQPLIDALKAFSRLKFTEFKAGRFVVSTSGAGKSVSFNVPPIGAQMQFEALAELSQEFREVYASALALHTGIDETDVSNNATLLAEMMNDDRLQTVTRSQGDFVGLRYGSFGYQ